MPVAASVARQFNAHLIGLYAVHSPDIYASVSMQLSGDAIAEIKHMQQSQQNSVKAVFDAAASKENFQCEWRVIETSSSATGEKLAEQARCADLVIMSQVDPEDSQPGPAARQRHLVEHSGRPVLVIPRYGNFETIGTRTLLGWSATGESARAVHDAMPFIINSDDTRVFWVEGSDSTENSKLENTGHEIARCINRHGAKATVSHRKKTEISIGDELLNEAADTDTDLIVTGAYGHSKLYDFVLGATTSHLSRYMTVPVLFSN